ncbi:histidine kinase dimerization/phospho-acceptor domain-containing protein, partial [Cutibacterium acnes]
LCAITVFFFPITIALIIIAILFTHKKAVQFDKIVKGVRRIKEGELDYGIEIIGDDAFSNLAKDINEISEGLKEAVDKELKSERHKTELITNVSHDIRTPLTSIITYVALLKKEGLSSENASKYLNILEQKSQRLKALTDDLFEAAKATSGSIVVEYEKIDISSLLTQ